MDRIQELRKYVSKDKVGIEIGPWFNPATPKREGYRCLVLDVFDTATLVEKAKKDPSARHRIDEIEEVDLVGSAGEIADIVETRRLTGKVDYIVSSHNFEHLPDPIRFLQACERVLKPGGVLSMAIPDRRTCFDYFRPHTTLSAWLEAHFEGRKTPNFRQIFDHHSLHSLYDINGQTSPVFTSSDDPANVVPAQTLEDALNYWQIRSAAPNPDYPDVHCSVFTPASFELLASDLFLLKLIGLQLIEVRETNVHEFFAHLQRPSTPTAPPDRFRFYQRRASLLHKVNSEAGANSVESFRMHSELARALQKVTEQEKQIHELDAVAGIQEKHIHELNAVIAGVEASKSWRLTAPLRAISTALRRRRQLHHRNG